MRARHPLPRALRRGLLTALPPVARAAGLRVSGAEHLPARGEAAILACNHLAFVDSLWLHLACPVGLSVCGARARLYRNAGLRGLLAVGQVLPVDTPLDFARVAGDVLDRGRPVLAYPEMGRRPDGLGAFDECVAALALSAGVPLVPAWISGTLERGAPAVAVGPRLSPEGNPAALTQALRARVAALAPA